jgi:hypothetical protein
MAKEHIRFCNVDSCFGGLLVTTARSEYLRLTPFSLLFLLLMILAGQGKAATQGDVREATGASGSAKPPPAAREEAMIGVNVGTSNNHHAEIYRKCEFLGAVSLPWAWRGKSGWRFSLRVDFTAAVLKGGPDWAVLGSMGPSVSLRKGQWRLALDGGMAPALLSRHRFGKTDNLGGHFQICSHAGLTYLVHRRLTVGYQWQHLSNASVYSLNPGIDFHSLQLAYLFW